jgi:hypothetical protein
MRSELDQRYRAMLRDAGLTGPAPNPYTELDREMRRIIERSGIPDPGPTYVGVFPHRSFNARAQAGPGGTLILLNTGLRTLLDRVASTLAASTRTFTRDENRRVRTTPVTPDEDRTRSDALAGLTRAVLAYVRQTPDTGGPMALGEDQRRLADAVARSAERFAVGHEYGHLLAGHLHHRPGAGDTRSESEADELATLLLLRGLDAYAKILQGFVLAGPFLFLATDHLVTRVRDRVLDLPAGLFAPTHPPSDARAADVRAVIEQTAGHDLLHIADAFVTTLSGWEEPILRSIG